MNKIRHELFFDIETKHWFDEQGIANYADLGVSIVCAYDRVIEDGTETSGQMYSFWDKQLDGFWQLCWQADRIIGFNSLGFDVPVLGFQAPKGFGDLRHFDIYDRIKEFNDSKAASLNAIAKSTLGRSKVDSGENATVYWQAGDPESLKKLEYYCQKDVEITKEVYDFAMLHKKLMFIDRWNTYREVTVDFSYQDDESSTVQPSLF
jgi:DEAD/DEAH box helicase domain-containing protein